MEVQGGKGMPGESATLDREMKPMILSKGGPRRERPLKDRSLKERALWGQSPKLHDDHGRLSSLS